MRITMHHTEGRNEGDGLDTQACCGCYREAEDCLPVPHMLRFE